MFRNFMHKETLDTYIYTLYIFCYYCSTSTSVPELRTTKYYVPVYLYLHVHVYFYKFVHLAGMCEIIHMNIYESLTTTEIYSLGGLIFHDDHE